MNNKSHIYNIIDIEETASTNSYIKDLALHQNLEEFTVVSANYQCAGRGQQGNKWESEKGKNLLFSLLLRPTFIKANEQFIISQIVALAIKKGLNKYTDNITIKWPNDIYYKDDKICGILIEHEINYDFIEQTIVGVGLNINQTIFKSDAPNPISLKEITGKEEERYSVLVDIVKNIINYYTMLQQGHFSEIREKYYNALYRKEGTHLFKSKDQTLFEAKIIEIKNDGQLILELTDGKLKSFFFKEVQFC